VEYYQPAYMIGGINLIPQRECKDRCRVIEKSMNSSIAGLRILDIGSSLGYICYYFVDRGAVTEGWESNPKNVEVARLIGQINGIPAKFKTKELYLETLDDIHIEQFDIVIILSVLHHIIHFKGLQYVQEIVEKIIEKVPTLIVELALKNEDESLFWNDAQPENELAIFDLIKDEIIIEKIGEFSTHLSLKQRPLYKISKKKKDIMINGKSYMYDKKTNLAYNDSEFPYLYPELSRNYYFSNKYIIKEYLVKIFDDNMKQITTEIGNMLFLNEITKIKSTRLTDFEISNNRAVVVLACDDGDLISDILDKKKIDPAKVAKDVLEFLAVLEENNYHHNDIRSWNILWNGENAQVIDYGLMSPVVKDDDIVSLLKVLDAIIIKRKESSVHGIKSFPPKEHFIIPCLKKLYEFIEEGERSPKKIIEYLTNEEKYANE
jgi:O-antigen chain-terminating methyltransferase